MDPLRKHEEFEMLTLATLNSARILPELIFGGATMLRLCHGLDRYSVDLDFYLLKSQSPAAFLARCVNPLGTRFAITGAADKKNTILIELSSMQSPRKLKVEINKVRMIKSWKREIAWSPFSSLQVLVNTVALEEMAQMKVNALLDRKEIRDAYDLEFLVKKQVHIPGDAVCLKKVLSVIQGFGHQDFSVKLGSIVEEEKRRYYIDNHFMVLTTYLDERISAN